MRSTFQSLTVSATVLVSTTVLVSATVLAAGVALSRPFFDPRSEQINAIDADPHFAAMPADAACSAAKLVSTGGPTPRNPHTLVVRWTGFSNFELAYRDKIILLDAFIDRGSNYPPLGFAAADVKRADVIVIGHAHFDHMSDAASIALRTRALVVGAPVTTEKLASQSVPPAQIRTVTGKGDEVLQFDGFTIEPILARHGQPDHHITEVMEGALNAIAPKPTPAQEAEEKTIRARGSSDSRIIREGTIAYLITLDDGFRIMYRDSGGHVTDQEKAVMQRVGGVDLALVAVSADFLPSLTVQQALEHVQLYKPDVYMPAHHDAAFAGHTPLWRATEPVFQALKDANPHLVTVSRGYREPVCFNTEINLSQNGRH
jgi:L-ascorbate metabolism protein UlaG (beta-lactamase superfamily)